MLGKAFASRDATDELLTAHAWGVDLLNAYYWGVLAIWATLTGVLGLAFILIAYLATRIGGHEGNNIAVSAFVFVQAVCITGGADGVWRSSLIRAALNRRKRTGVLDAGSWRLLRAARIYDATFVLQLMAGAFFAWWVY